MRILTDQKEIQKAQEIFRTSLDIYKPELIPVVIGYQSGSIAATVNWISKLGIWAHFGLPPEGKSEGGRFWNVFGLGKPSGMVSIVCEINPPFEGIRRVVAGAFIKDQAGDIWVVHRGRFNIAGGITKKTFRKLYPKPYVAVVDGDKKSDIILIGNLGSASFGESLQDFILQVDRIKEIARGMNRR